MSYEQKLDEYVSILNFDHEFYGKDCKNNLRFIRWSIKKLIKEQYTNEQLCDFIQMTINIHKQSYLY
jgi:hypothetical protein